MNLVELIYQITQQFPEAEKFGLTSQIRRSAVSIPSNIAEGARRNSDKEFRHFLGIASGSGGELYTQLVLAERLGFIRKQEVDSVIEKVELINKMISKLIYSFSK